MSRMCAGDRYASKKFLLLALLLCYVSSANCFYNPFSSKAVVDQSAREVGSSRGNVTARSWHSDSDALSNSTAKGSEAEEGRVFFGGKGIFAVGRRLRFAILPIMYKLGVISTMLVGITVMVLKGLTIGVILLFFALGNTFAKFKTHHIPQPVHFHLHSGHPGDIHHKVPVYSSYEPSGPWDKSLDEVDGTSHYENYDPSAPHRRIQPYRHSYTYPSRGYYGYYGR